MTISELYAFGRKRLEECEIKEAGLDARLLLEWVCGITRTDILAYPDREIPKEDCDRYSELLERRALREPLQYITGEQDFMGLPMKTGRDTLIPRQDTEFVVEEAMSELHDGMEILDVCCGTGCILLSLLHYSNDCRGVGAEINPSAVELARANAKNLKSLNGKEYRAEFIVSDMFEKVEGKYDMILSNPPYIQTDVIAGLEPEVKDFEPVAALDGGPDGLRFYRILAKEAGQYLKRDGILILEIGYDQSGAVTKLLQDEGFRDVVSKKDYNGLYRVVRATYR